MQSVSAKEYPIPLHSLPTWTSFATLTNGKVYIKSALIQGCKIGAFKPDDSIVFLNRDSMVTPVPVTAGCVVHLS